LLLNQELKIRGVTDVVRLCNPTYDKKLLLNEGIQVHDWAFVDGGVPPAQILADYLSLCEQRFHSISLTKEQIQGRKIDIIESPPVIAIHCVAGLGRAPLMVAICLIEAGFAPMDAVDFVRKCRRGAFNATQLKYLIDDYKKRTAKSSFGFLKRAVTPPKDSEEKGFSLKGFFKIKK
jgi:protein tyrosine phosphatase type 4A